MSGVMRSGIKYYNIPFILVVFSFINVWISEVINIHSLNTVTDLLIVGVFLVFFLFGKIKIPRRLLYGIAPMLVVVFVSILYNYYHYSGFFSGSGVIGVFIVTTIFIVLLWSNKNTDHPYFIIKKIGLLYLIHLIYIVFEVLLLEMKGYYFLKSIIPTYRNLENNSPNGIMVGPQVASQLLVLSFMWFVHLYKVRFVGKVNNNLIIFVVSTMIIYFATGTSIIMLAVMIFMSMFFIPKIIINNSLYKLRYFIFVFLGLLLVFNLSSLMNVVVTEELFEFYFFIFYDTIEVFLNSSLEGKLFGLPDAIHNLNYGDFGLGNIVVIGGALLFCISVITLLFVYKKIFFTLRRKYNNMSTENGLWLILLSASSISAAGWFASLVHYGVAVETGGKHFFSLLLAVMVVSLFKLKDNLLLYQKNN